MDKPLNIDIVGSCVTRDAVAYLPDDLSVATYVARTSVVSAVSSPISLNLSKTPIEAKCDFDRKSIVRDLKKTVFDDLSSSPASFLIIDFIDERFALGRDPSGQFFTKSNELIRSKLLSDCETFDFGTSRLDKSHTLSNSFVEECFHEWSSRLLSIYPEDHIVIHGATFVDHYLDRESSEIKMFDSSILHCNKLWNTKLAMLCDLARKYFPPTCVYLSYAQEYCADSAHKWGLSSCHYQPEYYRRVADDIKRACFQEYPPQKKQPITATSVDKLPRSRVQRMLSSLKRRKG